MHTCFHVRLPSNCLLFEVSHIILLGVTCSSSAATQFSSMMANINTCKANWSGRVWLDIENSALWTGSTTSNKSWYQNLVNACTSTAGVSCGIYSSQSQWIGIFGSSTYTYGSNLPLW